MVVLYFLNEGLAHVLGVRIIRIAQRSSVVYDKRVLFVRFLSFMEWAFLNQFDTPIVKGHVLILNDSPKSDEKNNHE